MLRIDITKDGSLKHLRLIGDLRVDELEELERHLNGSSEEVTLDMEELKDEADIAALTQPAARPCYEGCVAQFLVEARTSISGT